jgi:STE24 endopeptidase
MTQAAAATAVLGALLLLAITARWVPRQPVPGVTDTDLARDFTEDERRRERAFRRRVRPWGLLAVALDVLVPTLLVGSGAVDRVVDAVPGPWWCAVLVAFLVPVLVEPLFLRFAPMPDGAQRDELLALAAADGVDVTDVLVADASRRTSALNAYVSGLGRTRRIVVHDTLLDRGADDEVRAVVAHELGHVVAHDVRTGTLLGALGAAVTVAVAAVLLAQPTVLGWGHAVSVGDPAVVGLLVAGGAWLGLLSAPAQNAVSRRIERRADEHCLALTGDAEVVARMQRTLAVTNLAPLRPPPVLHLWFGTHPTSPERIAAARAWAAEHDVAVPDLV